MFYIELAFLLLILCRCVLWLAALIFIIAAIRGTVRRRPVDMTDWGLFFVACAAEWYFREALFDMAPVYNPFAYWWERKIVPIVILVLFCICAILNKIVCLGGPKKALKRIAIAFFESINDYKSLIIDLDQRATRHNISAFMLLANLIAAVAIVLFRISTILMCLPGVAFLFCETLQFAVRAFSSVRKLLLFWVIGAVVMGALAISAVISVSNSTNSSYTTSAVGAYALFTVVFVLWWVITGCMAEAEVVKVAASFVNAVTTIATVVGNIILAYVQEWLSSTMGQDPLKELVNASFIVTVNMFLLPVLTAGLLTSAAKELQLYCMQERKNKGAVN